MATRDLATVQRLGGSPMLLAVFDMPWTPIFIPAILTVRPWLGTLGRAGGALLVAIPALNRSARSPAMDAAPGAYRAERVTASVIFSILVVAPDGKG